VLLVTRIVCHQPEVAEAAPVAGIEIAEAQYRRRSGRKQFRRRQSGGGRFAHPHHAARLRNRRDQERDSCNHLAPNAASAFAAVALPGFRSINSVSTERALSRSPIIT